MVSFSCPKNPNGTPDGRPSDDHTSAVVEPDLNPAEAEEMISVNHGRRLTLLMNASVRQTP